MTQLLISVQTPAEALLALEAGADVIDLKDPNVGALGALELAVSAEIARAINGRVLLSATVGEAHESAQALIQAVEARAKLGVDIIKLAIEEMAYSPQLLPQIKLAAGNSRLMAVFFADKLPDLSLLPKLAQAGFYGAMLDTQNKQKSLLQMLTQAQLQEFAHTCQQLSLKNALAGSLKPQDIEFLSKFNPTYLGFRGAVCENNIRRNTLNSTAVNLAASLLHKHNKRHQSPLKSKGLQLQS